MEDENKEQWTAINKKAGSAFLMWGFGILIIVLMAIFAGLWRGQVGIENKIIGAFNSHREATTNEIKGINGQLGGIKTDITVMQNNFENYLKTGKWVQRRNHEKKGRNDDEDKTSSF